jgi:hypothetical protein
MRFARVGGRYCKPVPLYDRLPKAVAAIPPFLPDADVDTSPSVRVSHLSKEERLRYETDGFHPAGEFLKMSVC